MNNINSIHAKVARVFKENKKSKQRTIINVGGARSGKSYAIAQLLIMHAQNQQGISHRNYT